jgi:hypothetical protein
MAKRKTLQAALRNPGRTDATFEGMFLSSLSLSQIGEINAYMANCATGGPGSNPMLTKAAWEALAFAMANRPPNQEELAAGAALLDKPVKERVLHHLVTAHAKALQMGDVPSAMAALKSEEMAREIASTLKDVGGGGGYTIVLRSHSGQDVVVGRNQGPVDSTAALGDYSHVPTSNTGINGKQLPPWPPSQQLAAPAVPAPPPPPPKPTFS